LIRAPDLIQIASSLGGLETVVEMPYDLDWYGKEHLPMNASGSDVCSGRRSSKWQARHGFGFGSYESRSRRQDRQSAGRLHRTRERVEPVTKGSSSVVGCIRQPMFFGDLSNRGTVARSPSLAASHDHAQSRWIMRTDPALACDLLAPLRIERVLC